MARVEISAAQRAYILDRDSHYCHFPIRHCETNYRPCKWDDHLEIHHIVPYRWAQERLGWELDQINAPENLLTVCRWHHRRVLHPDLYQAQQLYTELGRKAFDEVFSFRRKLTNQGIPYWYPIYDEVLRRIAVSRTEKCSEQWPQRRVRRLAA